GGQRAAEGLARQQITGRQNQRVKLGALAHTPASRQAAQIFAGVAGMSMRAPVPGMASAIAFMTAASDPVVPASPTPLTPSGLVVAGTDCSTAVSRGMMSARGMA